MKLYYSPGACSLAPHIVACEAGLPLELVKVNLKAKKTEDDRDYLAINPKGYVPALDMGDGIILTEVPAIVQYLADRKPESGLAPQAGTLARYRLQEWLTFIGTELHKQVGPLFSPATPPEARQAALDRIGGRFAYIAKQLDGRSFLTGDTFTGADAYLYVVLSWAPMLKIDLAAWPALRAFADRVGTRPGVQEARKQEGLG